MRSQFWTSAIYAAGIVVTLVFIAQFIRGMHDEYEGMKTRVILAESRAAEMQKQLDIMFKHGDNGVLIANITPDFGPFEIRIIPKQRR